MSNNFNEIMSRKSDLQLMAILTTEKDQFQPEALIAAEQELNKRNLSIADIETLKSWNESKAKEEKEKAEVPLEMFWKALAFFIPGLIPVIFSGTFKADGYHFKARELMRWTVYGIIFYVLVITIIKTLGI